ncbi:hypothetical protein, conserved [Plasmodium gonderi]|uniref:Uncharacterized protein n=1 Tax=Plasmodium gonderi TaxID=77519 RepID=A0A1Y1JIG1_PLAGO|nr:hypothetical protein, conserved [Plasmodium gonderi]GAW80592.1 hypothetical protein, conserved [Plasmodium gonderi]
MYTYRKIFNFYKNNTFAFYLGNTWFLLISSSLVFSVKYFKNFENRHSYIEDAVNILKVYLHCTNDTNIRVIKKKGNIDSSNERAKCELLLFYKGEKIQLHVNAIKEDKEKERLTNSADSYDEDSKDISDYLENPYLIKREIKFLFHKLRSFILSFISSRENGNDKTGEIGKKNAQSFQTNETRMDNKQGDVNNLIRNKNEEILNIIQKGKMWKISNIIMVKKNKYENEVHGNGQSLISHINKLIDNFFHYKYEIHAVYGNPIHNSYYYKYDKKKRTFSETQKNIGKVTLCAFLFSTLLAIKRIFIYKNSYSSLNFVKHFVLNNKELYKIMGNSQIQILSISGMHEKNYLNSKVFIQVKETQGVVQITATKNKMDKHFFILHAKLLLNNETIELKKY